MRSTHRGKLAAAARARELCQANPFTDPGHQAVVAQLAELIGRAQRVAIDETAGRKGAAGAARGRKASRAEITTYLRLAAKVGVRADHEVPGLGTRLTAPSSNAAIATFVARGWAIHQEVKANLDVLTRNGLGSDLLEDLAEALTRVDAETERGNAGRAAHVAAAAQLGDLTNQIGELIGILDAVNRIRFRDNPGLLAAWTSARNVAGPSSTPSTGSTMPVDPTPGTANVV